MISCTSNNWLMVALYVFRKLEFISLPRLELQRNTVDPFQHVSLVQSKLPPAIICWKQKNCVQFTITGNNPLGWTECKCENPIWNQNNNNTAYMQGLHLLKEFSPCIKRVFRVFSRHVRLVNSGSTTQKIFLPLFLEPEIFLLIIQM